MGIELIAYPTISATFTNFPLDTFSPFNYKRIKKVLKGPAMMELTRKGEYAVRGVIYLSRQAPGKISLISEIAEATGAPQTFLAKIFQNFAKIGLVNSFRGTGGGFTLGRLPAQITLREVVEAVEGPIAPNRCLVGSGNCDRGAQCNVHPVWRKVQSQVVEILDSVNFEELANQKT
jgi:Rrf2 family protein